MCARQRVIVKDDDVFGFESVYRAYKACRKNKTNKINTLKFESNLIENLWNLSDELKTKRYKVGKSLCFLTHSPKLREIFAAEFRDRIVHYILTARLEKFYEPKFIYDLYSNRKDKGIHKASRRAKFFMNKQDNKYYLQLDIKGFFYALDKNILFKQIFDDLSYSNIQNKKVQRWS